MTRCREWGTGFRPTTRRSPPRSVPHWCTSSSSSCCSWSSWPLHGMPSERSVSGGRRLPAPWMPPSWRRSPIRSLRDAGCSGSPSGSSGSSTACSRSRDRCHSACRGPSSLRRQAPPLAGCNTWSTSVPPSGPTTRCPQLQRPCGYRSASACSSWWRHVDTGRGPRGVSASAGASWCGCSARHSAASSDTAAAGCSAHPGRFSSMRSPVR